MSRAFGAASALAVSSSRLVTVDALRGVACLWVALFHIGAFLQRGLWTGWVPLLAPTEPLPLRALGLASRLGFQGVSLFLVLSGFCLAFPMFRRTTARNERVPLAAFARARLLRILPPYYASLAVLWALTAAWAPARWAIFAPIEAWDVAVHAVLVHNLVPSSMLSIDGVYWSLALEAQLYVVFPLLLALGRRVGFAWVAGACLGLALAYPAFLARALPDLAGDAWPVFYESLPARIGEFATGMLTAALVVRGAPALVARVAWVLAFLWLPASYVVHVTRTVELPIDKPACALSFAAWIYLAVQHEPKAPAWALRALAHVGTVSFSLYLIQQPLLLAARPSFAALDLSSGAAWALAVGAGVPVLIAAASGFWFLFEAPFLPGGVVRARFAGMARAGGGSTRNKLTSTS